MLYANIMNESRRAVDCFFLSLAVVGACAWVGIALLGSMPAHPIAFVTLYGIAFFAYYLGVCRVTNQPRTKHALLLIVLAGLCFRILAFGGAPSDDIYRYLWEGEVQRQGLNPYVLPPNAPELATLRENRSYASLINHEDWTAIYPPVAMLWHRLFGESIAMLKASFLVAEGILLFFVWRLLVFRQMAPERLLIYWWNPLPVFAFSFEGHHDVIALAFLMAALYGLIALRHQVLSAVVWMAAVSPRVLPLWSGPFWPCE